MTTREKNITLAIVGLGAISFAVVSGLTQPDGDLDWIGIITAAAGAVLVIVGLFNVFRHGTA
jgi:hypothetical protein